MIFSSLKFKTLAIIAGTSIFLSVLLAFFAPRQSKNLGSQIMQKDAAFITNLLQENLAMGMQTMILDDGEALKKTLNHLDEDTNEKMATISMVKVFDPDLNYVTGLKNDTDKKANYTASKDTQLEEHENIITVWSPLLDNENSIQGYVEIHFSKEYLIQKTASNSRNAIFISIIAFAITFSIGYFIMTPIINALQKLTRVSKEVALGNVDVSIDAHSSDEIGTLADSFREMIASQKDKVEVAQQIAQGNLNVETHVLSDGDVLGKAMARMKNSINALISDVNQLSSAAIDGQLSTRVDVNKHHGEYRKIVEGINKTMDSVLNPIHEASSVVELIAQRNLKARMNGSYRGDHANLKKVLNEAIENLDSAMSQVLIGSTQVNIASDQIKSGSESLSQAASEQASSLEEISSSLKEMAAMIRQDTNNTVEASSMSEKAHESTAEGMESMKQLSDVIERIKTSSDETSKVIKTIDDIAFQTNLLALNAAVEAARAGEAGKGFAVVAEEVRNLAMRSAEAAKNTSALIEEAVSNAENGVDVNRIVVSKLENINEQVRKVKDVINEITVSAQQQTQGIEQINSAIDQLNQLTQQNAANSEESASTAAELAMQAETMTKMVNSFKLTNTVSRQHQSVKRPVYSDAQLF
ncbi:HAMP domain-containing protein [candidate division KSB1 bacterium]|nr:HAMP domain-containing protein [candidate division KSB1 bacterium]